MFYFVLFYSKYFYIFKNIERIIFLNIFFVSFLVIMFFYISFFVMIYNNQIIWKLKSFKHKQIHTQNLLNKIFSLSYIFNTHYYFVYMNFFQKKLFMN